MLIRILAPRACIALASCAAALAGAPAEATTLYQIEDLGACAGASAMNASDMVGGSCLGQYERLHAWRWVAGQGRVLNDGGFESVGLAMDARGDLVGYDYVAQVQLPTVWLSTGGHESLPMLPGAVGGSATAVMQDGSAVFAWNTDATGHQHCTRWSPSGGTVDLGHLGTGKDCQPWGVSATGIVVGGATETVHGPMRAFAWQAGKFKKLPSLYVGGNAIAYDIDSTGDVYGMADLDNHGDRTAVRWHHGGVIDIGQDTTWMQLQADSSDGLGHVVGYGLPPYGGTSRAMDFSSGHAVPLDTEVSNLGKWQLLLASQVLDGVIVGLGELPDGRHAFRLSPLN